MGEKLAMEVCFDNDISFNVLSHTDPEVCSFVVHRSRAMPTPTPSDANEDSQ